MDAKEFCRKIYQETVKRSDNIPSELKRSLRTHERVPAFIDNLAAELMKANPKTSRANLEVAVIDLTRLFITLIKKQADEKAMSPIAQMMERAKMEKRKQLERDLATLEKGATTHVTQTKKGIIETQTIIADGIEA